MREAKPGVPSGTDDRLLSSVGRGVGDSPAALPLSDIQRIAWEKCGIVRSGAGLTEACRLLEPHANENSALVALLIARCAMAREESRGAHFRTDFPVKSEAFARHSVVSKNADITFR
jgi:L-aspartate oxidase